MLFPRFSLLKQKNPIGIDVSNMYAQISKTESTLYYPCNPLD